MRNLWDETGIIIHMSVPVNFVYLVATSPLLIIWLFFFYLRKDLRKEILAMSLLMGFLSVATSYYWWTLDWWNPPTITATKVGIEDFIMGFATGGIMAAIYEVIFKKRLYRRKPHHLVFGGLTILLLLAQGTSWFVWGVGLTTFWSSSIAMVAVALLMLVTRKDLLKNALGSAFLMVIASLPFYLTILLISPEWVSITYHPTLSGLRPMGIPVEEFVFWFLAGLVWGPFYEYWQGERCRKMSYRSSHIIH